MLSMRIVWKDSANKECNPTKYRGYWVEGSYSGWHTNMPGDDNLYKNTRSALNAIDEYLGGNGKSGYAKRREYGIQIIGKKKRPC